MRCLIWSSVVKVHHPFVCTPRDVSRGSSSASCWCRHALRARWTTSSYRGQTGALAQPFDRQSLSAQCAHFHFCRNCLQPKVPLEHYPHPLFARSAPNPGRRTPKSLVDFGSSSMRTSSCSLSPEFIDSPTCYILHRSKAPPGQASCVSLDPSKGKDLLSHLSSAGKIGKIGKICSHRENARLLCGSCGKFVTG